ncbi:MAG: asparagine synthase-related protein [bacterium]|nr:asparagine synthase-related protein [bacterium]
MEGVYEVILMFHINDHFDTDSLVAYFMSLPWDRKIRNGYMNAVMRDAVSELVPDEVVWRKTKISFNSPIVDWMQGLLSECFLDLLASADFKTCALVDPVSTREKILQLTSGRSFSFADAQGAWEGLSPYMWERSLEKNAVPPGAGAVQGEKP